MGTPAFQRAVATACEEAARATDFYAACARLNGFGLAIEVVRNTSRMQPHEYCFRPPRRGVALLEYLERFRLREREQSA